MTDTDLLVLDRGQGKSTAIIQRAAKARATSPTVGQYVGIILVTDQQRAYGLFQTAAYLGVGRMTSRKDVMPLDDHRAIVLTTPDTIERCRGFSSDVPVWIDDAQDFLVDPVELVGQVLAHQPELVTCTPWPAPGSPPRNDHPAPPAYNPRLIRHTLGRMRHFGGMVRRGYDGPLAHPVLCTGYLAGGKAR